MSATAELTHQISSAQYIATEIKKHKKGFAVSAAVVFAVVLATVGYFVFARRTVALTDKDTILISDFVNTTGDGVFDGTLKQGACRTARAVALLKPLSRRVCGKHCA